MIKDRSFDLIRGWRLKASSEVAMRKKLVMG